MHGAAAHAVHVLQLLVVAQIAWQRTERTMVHHSLFSCDAAEHHKVMHCMENSSSLDAASMHILYPCAA
jgi:hypothetical protein